MTFEGQGYEDLSIMIWDISSITRPSLVKNGY